MSLSDFSSLLAAQRRFFASGATIPLAFRIEQLKKLRSILQTHESEIVAALKADLNKPTTETVLTEIIVVSEELEHTIKNLKRWIVPQSVASTFPLCWPGRSSINFEPYGNVLIIGPWNFPFHLVLAPLIGAIAAGNCAIIKPSELAVNTQNVIVKLIQQYFPAEYITTVIGGHAETSDLLKEKFDYLFYTGGTHVGKIIMQAAAQHLTPLTLELGGKSPCIVDESANLDFAARRIVRAKFLNTGQMCIAPDYLYLHRSLKTNFIEKLIATIEDFFGKEPIHSESYGRIINAKHFTRIVQLLANSTIIYGGNSNEAERYIAPTLIENVSWEHPVMQEEIFGPILPILLYDNLEDVIQCINSQPKPLSLYLFTRNKAHEKAIITRTSFGGGCINDCSMHIANYHLPFGGVGNSGLGAYHGRFSYETFSHRKSIFKKTLPLDLSIEYPPYSDHKLKWLRRLFKL